MSEVQKVKIELANNLRESGAHFSIEWLVKNVLDFDSIESKRLKIQLKREKKLKRIFNEK